MKKLLSALALAASLTAPLALHADSLMSGQFSIQGTVTNVGSTLEFMPNTIETGADTQTGTFKTLLGETPIFASAGTPNIAYNPYAGGAFLTVGPLTATITSLTEQTYMILGQTILGFAGTADFSAAGYLTTPGTFTFSTQQTGAVTFSATANTVSPVPEPGTLSLFGTGALGLAGLAKRKLLA